MDRLLANPAARSLAREDLITLLSLTAPEDVARLRRAAFDLASRTVGDEVYYRGIVEFSNECARNCHYCGIRAGNREVERYRLSREEVVDCALWAAAMGYGSCVLQSGEKWDEDFVEFVEGCVREIKERSRGPELPDGLGVTLAVGEQTPETYRRFRAAGAHRYLLRIETSNPELFARLHPAAQRFQDRVACLASLREAGFQVGTGVMIGIPGQTVGDLADDILFFRDQDVDMIGMGPYIVHDQSPLRGLGMMPHDELLSLALNMIAVTRLALPDVNIAATTALQALAPDGREQGIACGANVIMPNLTPQGARRNYRLYEGKPCLDEGRDECRVCLQHRVETAGRTVARNAWGDSRHVARRRPPLA